MLPNSERGLRPLLPAQSRSDNIATSTAPKERPGLKKNPSIANACAACRKRKTKCTGERPKCYPCVHRSIVCEYLAQPKESHLQAMKRKYGVLVQQERQESTCSELVAYLRSITPEASIRIIECLRAGYDVEEILSEVQTGNLLLQLRTVPETKLRYSLPYTIEIPDFLLTSGSSYFGAPFHSNSTLESANTTNHGTSLAYQSCFHKPYHSATLVEPCLNQVRPSLWSAVTKDDNLMRDLIGAYLTREYHLYPIFQKDYFLEDMASGGAECCSPLLVNIVLAYGCCCSPKISTRYAYWNPQGLSYQFLAEAKRILELQILKEQHCSLTTIQALMLINVYYNICGLDLLGKDYGSQGLAIAFEMRLFEDNSHITSKRFKAAMNFTAWALFNMDSFDAIHFLRKPSLTHQPSASLPDPSLQPEWYGEICLRYPLDHTLTPSHYGQFFMTLSKFRVILNAICHASFDKSSSMTSGQARAFGEQLLEWYNSLPGVLTPKSIFLPSHYLLHFEYYTVILMLYQPFREMNWDDGFSAETAIRDAQQNLGILARIYFIRHSFEATDVYLLSVLSMLGFMCLQYSEHQPGSVEEENFRSTLALVLQGLYSQGQHVNITRNVYSLIKKLTPPTELSHIKHLEELQVDQDIEGTEYIKGEVQARWDPSVTSISDNDKAKGLSILILKSES